MLDNIAPLTPAAYIRNDSEERAIKKKKIKINQYCSVSSLPFHVAKPSFARVRKIDVFLVPFERGRLA